MKRFRFVTPRHSSPPLALGLLLIALGGALTLACKASVQGDARASSSGESEADFDAESKRDEAWASETLEPAKSTQTKASGTSPTTAPAQAALLGARHDLSLSEKTARERPPTCKCLAVVAGAPSQAGFVWSAAPPTIDTSAQLVIGFTSAGVPCDKAAPPASYMGYEVRDSNVVVRVEGAVEGRPLTRGAIVPKPSSGGKLLFEATPGLPYGTAASGQGACQVL